MSPHLVVAPILLPLLAGLLLLVLGTRRVQVQRWIGTLACLGGIALAGALALQADDGGTRVYLVGNWAAHLGIALVAAAVACEVVFILGQRQLRTPIEPLVMATLMSAGGFLLSLPAAGVVWATGSPSVAVTTTGLWPALAAVAWYAWVPTVIGFWLWYAGARRATATQAAASTAWMPLVAVTGAAVVLDEALTASQLAALALVLAGMLVGSINRRKAG